MDVPENRLAVGRRRGPAPGPTKTPLPEPAKVVEIPQPPVIGIICPSCGRGATPRRDRVEGVAKCYAHCNLCGARLVLTFVNGKPSTVRLVRPGDSASS